MPNVSRRLLALLLGILAPVLPVAGQTGSSGKLSEAWPLFRGNPMQTGVASATLPSQLEVRGTFRAKDSFEAAVAIAGGTVYAGSYDETLYALELATGKVKWQQKIGPIKAPPSVRDGAVYVGTEDGAFVCLDAATGAKRWTFETTAEITSGANFAGNKVLFGSYDGHLYCLDTAGKLLWKVKTDGPVNGSPAVVGQRTFVAGCDSKLHVIDLDTGKKLESVELNGQAAATAAVRGDNLYVGTMTNQVLEVSWKEAKVTWAYEPEERAQAFYASAAVTDTLVVAGSRDRKIHVLERKSGKPVWEVATGGRVDASPVVVGKRVYAASMDGKLYVLDLNKGTVLQKLELGRNIAASPAVADGCLVIGTTDGVLYCLGKKN
jgi:eukaryotic-like serine/threonine-protein kinase